MSKEIAHSLSGKRMAWLVSILAVAALLGTLGANWLQKDASASVPAGTYTLTQSPASGTVAYGATITYTLTGTAINGSSAGAVSAMITLPSGVDSGSVTCTGGGGITAAANASPCALGTWTNLSGGTFTLQITATVNATGAANGSTGQATGAVTDAGGGAAGSVSGSPVANLTVSSPLTISANASALVGQSIPVAVTLAAAGFDLCSIVSSNAAVTVAGIPTSTVAGPTTVNLTLTSGTTAAATTVTATAAPTGSCAQPTLTLTAQGTYTFTTLAAACTATDACELRHLDIDRWLGTGILDGYHDPDDARASYHQACIVNSPLTYADRANVTWSIQASYGAPNALLESEVAGPNNILCVQWTSSIVGDQTISATYTPTGDQIFWNGVNPAFPQALIKEWNQLDDTWLVRVTGVVGYPDVSGNSVELDNWFSAVGSDGCIRDDDSANSCILKSNVDGTTIAVVGTLGTAGNGSGYVVPPSTARSLSFIDYVLGSHQSQNAVVTGAVDGAAQKVSLTGTCGSARVENPFDGSVTILYSGNASRSGLVSSDQGLGITIFPTKDGMPVSTANLSNLDCHPGETTGVKIETEEALTVVSEPSDLDPEYVTVRWDVGAPTNKQPILAWAGQRVVLEHDWATDRLLDSQGRLSDVVCPTEDHGGGGHIHVLYQKQAQGPGGFGGMLGWTENDYYIAPNAVIIEVDSQPEQTADEPEPNSNCISRVLYESQDPGEVDVSAWIVDDDELFESEPLSQEVDFLIYYMKLESVTLGLVPGARAYHNAGKFGGSPFDLTKDVAEHSANVSADVLVRATVKGWFLNTNLTGREAGTDSNGGVLPAGRWVMPDDWQKLAGGALAMTLRPNYDIMLTSGGSRGCTTETSCSSRNPVTLGSVDQTNVVGPFSLLDDPTTGGEAPRLPLYATVSDKPTWYYRNTWLPDGTINASDAPMPPALVNIALSGSGYLKAVSKFNDIAKNNPFYVVNIPAEPWISPWTADNQGYIWNTWDGDGEYTFWTSAAGIGSEVYSAPGKDTAKTTWTAAKADTPGGFITRSKDETLGLTSVKLYSDNHGEVMVWVNGDAGLTMDECSDADSLAAENIVGLSGWYCEKGDKVGSSTLSATADYPDKRKHYPLASGQATVDWTWGGIKSVTVEDGENPQFKYVVFHVKDRDGFCTVPTTAQLNFVQTTYATLASTPTVETFPLYVRTSALQPLVTKASITVVVSGTGSGTSSTDLPSYASTGPLVPGAGTSRSAYQATTTNTGYPYVADTGAYTLHTVFDERVDFMLDLIGNGRIVDTSDGAGTAVIGLLGQDATVYTFDTADPNNALIKKAVVEDGECQAWVKISNSLLTEANILVKAYDPEGVPTFDRVIDFQNQTTLTLHFRWTLVTWPGEDGISVGDAIAGIVDDVTAVYGWDAAAQEWLAYFPDGVGVPGANDLSSLSTGEAYWIAIKGPSDVTWEIATNVD